MKSLINAYALRKFSALNELTGRPAAIRGRLSIDASKGANRLIVEDGVELRGVSIEFNGRGNTLIFRAGCRPSGRFIMSGRGTIEIGANTVFNKPCWMQANEGKTIAIGDECLLADVRIRTSDIHAVVSIESGERINHARDVTIGNRVWIAEGAHIYKGVTIGEGTVIAAHAVVVKSIPGNCVAAGNPAAVVRDRVTWKV